MMKRKLTVESLEFRRMLASAGLPGDDGAIIEVDGGERGPVVVATAPELSHEDGMPRDLPPGDIEGRPIPMEAHHFVAVLRPVPEPGPLDGSAESGQAEGEFGAPIRWRAGVARFFLNRDETSLRYRLNIPHLNGVDNATIHLGKPGEGGPAVATLFDLDAGSLDGISIRGTLTDDDVSAVDELEFDGTLSSLAKRMRGGEAYVEVASADHPDGALIGKIRPLGWRPWQNPVNRMDVTGDKIVSPQDALAVVEDMNEHGSRMVEAPPLGEPIEPQAFVDVSGDNLVTPSDVLQLIEFLNNHAAELKDGTVSLPETVSQTVEELKTALELDSLELPDVDYEQLIDRVLEHTDEIEQIVDRLADDVQQQYERYYAQSIGAPEEDPMSLDWEQMYRDVAEHFGSTASEFDWASIEEVISGFGNGPMVVGRGIAAPPIR